MPLVQVDWVLGLKAATPQYAAGRLTEATVWVPSASGTAPAPTAAAEPLDEPPGVCAMLCGLRAGDGSRYANSVVWVLPRTTAPASRSAATISASAVAGALPARDLLLASVVMPATSMLSLMPIGMPCS